MTEADPLLQTALATWKRQKKSAKTFWEYHEELDVFDLQSVSMDGVVDWLLRQVPVRTKVRLSQLSMDELGHTHHGFGMWLRNYFGLWRGNTDLMCATARLKLRGTSYEHWCLLNDEELQPALKGELSKRNYAECSPDEQKLLIAMRFTFWHPDEISGTLIKLMWQRLQNYDWPELRRLLPPNTSTNASCTGT